MLSYSHEHDQNPSFSDQQPDFTIRPADLTPYSQTYDSERQIEYGWIGVTDLDMAMMDETDMSYRLEAAKYADKEWSPESIKNVWQHIFNHPVMARHIVKLNRHSDNEVSPQILLGGAGTLRDTLLMALLHPKAMVTAYDSNDAMLEQGLQKVTWQYLVSLSHEIWKLNPEVNGFVRVLYTEWQSLQSSLNTIKGIYSQLSEMYDSDAVLKEFVNTFGANFDELMTAMLSSFDNVVLTIKNRISHHLTTHLDFPGNLGLEFQSVDLISDVATLQHVPKSLLDHAIALKLAMLTPGGVYSFDLRIDPEGMIDPETEQLSGRVFYDNELNANLRRSYATVITSELETLADRIEKNQLVTDPYISDILEQAEYKVTFGNQNNHPNPNKPAFRDIFVERVR